MTSVSWVVGAGGLLGSGVAGALDQRGPRWVEPVPIGWGHHSRAVDQIGEFTAQFLAAAGPRPWQVVWCAGDSVTGSTQEQLSQERRLFSTMLDSLRRGARPAQSQRGSVLVGSSAGALYAGSVDPPFTETSPVVPISAYGRAKLGMEEDARRWSADTGGSVVLGRISNLYGPGQNLRKRQGLISQIIRAHLLRVPLSIYVPLDTTRDYLYADDCGQLIADVLESIDYDASKGPRVLVKIVASQQGVTVGALLGEMRRIFKRKPQIVLGSSPEAALQARDLRLLSRIEPVLPRPLTPLSVGINNTVTRLRARLGQGTL